MNDEDVVRLCGKPRSTNIKTSNTNYRAGGNRSLDVWNYGNISIIFDSISGGLVIKGARTVDLNRYGIDGCQNILKSLYSE